MTSENLRGCHSTRVDMSVLLPGESSRIPRGNSSSNSPISPVSHSSSSSLSSSRPRSWPSSQLKLSSLRRRVCDVQSGREGNPHPCTDSNVDPPDWSSHQCSSHGIQNKLPTGVYRTKELAEGTDTGCHPRVPLPTKSWLPDRRQIQLARSPQVHLQMKYVMTQVTFIPVLV